MERRHQPCNQEQRQRLADALGDSPKTVIAVHLLRRGLCRAYIAGDAAHCAGAIVQGDALPAEPMGFGEDAATLWELLRSVEGWSCVNVSRSGAAALGALMEAQIERAVRHYSDLYYTLAAAVRPAHNEAVRLLTPDDRALLDAAPRELQGSGFGDTRTLLAEGVVAAAIVEGRVVAIAHTSARTPRHADIGVATLDAWRGRGFATAAASLVAERVQQDGQTPVWSTGEENHASRRVAQKLGFAEIGRRTYLIPA